ncbi:hypothetical protein LZ318_40130 [Saccharopolyspora indica]|uniref:hypothetical protein n=1 Tax=Saccharopolyspora indica TaxID=1229659 RepID=UPI0022EAF09E|nr:hypothetical protein [Saccharopolyspora indica]MDA3650181.1 hypothetical protein [Saccharopolyspora indica]
MKRLLLPALLLVLAGCGSEPRAMDHQIREQLLSHVDEVKTAAENNDRPAAEMALGELHRAIAEAQARGELRTETARALLTATERVAEDVRTMPLPEPPAPVTVTVTPDPPVVAPPLPEIRVEERIDQAERWEENRKLGEEIREHARRARENNGNGNGNNDD